MSEEKLGRDVFMALAAIAWADGKVDPQEADAICRTAIEEGLGIEEIEAIEKATKEKIAMSAVELPKMSKADRLFVYAVGTWISRVDGHVADEEKEALEELGKALKVPEAPRRRAEEIAEEIGQLSESEDPAFYNLPQLRTTLKQRLEEAAELRAAAKATEQEDDG